MRRLRWLATICALGLVAAACGRSSSSGTAAPPGGNATTTTAAAAAHPGDFGTLKDVCGPKPSGMTLEATDTGVTATSIQVSTVSDPGFAGRPGLNQELFDSATAFTKWCNDLGGINGRTIDLKLRDAKLTEFQQRVIEACDQGDFMMVGGGAVFDDTGQTNRLACGLPTIAGYVVTPQAAEADLTIQPVPNPVYSLPVGDFQWLAKQFPDATKHIGVFTGNIPTTVTVAKRYTEAMNKMGWKIVYSGQYNANGESTWRPFAETMKSKGVKGVVWVGEPGNLVGLMKAFSDIGYHPDFVRTDANHYDPSITDAGSATNGVYVRSVFYPFLSGNQAANNPTGATQKYLSLLKAVNGKVAYLGVQGMSAWLLFATAARDCGADVTRDCVYAKALDHTDWTGGGLHAPQDVKTDTASSCYDLFEAKDGTWVLPNIDPNNGIYNCAPGNVMKLTGDYGTGAKCPNPAYASDPKPSNCAKK